MQKDTVNTQFSVKGSSSAKGDSSKEPKLHLCQFETHVQSGTDVPQANFEKQISVQRLFPRMISPVSLTIQSPAHHLPAVWSRSTSALTDEPSLYGATVLRIAVEPELLKTSDQVREPATMAAMREKALDCEIAEVKRVYTKQNIQNKCLIVTQGVSCW
ncbi:hypothetical protein M9458_050700 [Cirrhinus mrigala]|uniref:Uncharacterized protein n=1 Tax=Cirrhinus mrigala TaxID=683832 RepID=A0ABD0MVH6_CIRMR